MGSDNAGKSHPAAGQLFEDQCECGVVDSAAVKFLRDVEAEESQALHRLDQRVRILTPMLHAGGHGKDFAFHKIAHGPRDHLLLFGEFEHGFSSRSACRKTLLDLGRSHKKIRGRTTHPEL